MLASAASLDGVRDGRAHLVALTRDLVVQIRDAIDDVGFWANAVRQDQLRKEIKRELDGSGLFASLAVCDQLASQLVDLAKHNHHRLVGP